MMQIKTIILYGNNGLRRDVHLDLGSVNIITGRSKTGKSVIGDVIDYCLGGSSCNIAEGIVRRSVAWYALLLQFDNEQMLVARRNPDPKQQSSSEFYYAIAETVVIPTTCDFVSNADTATIESILGNRLGIKDNQFTPPEGQSRDPIKANIRHALSYCFQKQSVVAVNTQLFHRQNETFVAQAIKDTLPYFWGVIDDRLLSLESERTQLKREIVLLKRAIAEQEAIVGDGLSRAYSLLSEAETLGMVHIPPTSSPDLSQAISLLRTVQEWTPSSKGSTNNDQILTLQLQIEHLTDEISRISESITITKGYIGEDERFSSQVQEQKFRLESIGLFEGIFNSGCVCPLCSSPMAKPLPNSEQLRQSIAKLDAAIGQVERERPHLVQHIVAMQEEKEKYIYQRKQLEQNLAALIAQDEQDRLLSDKNARCGRVIGRISLWLESVEEPQDDTVLRNSLVAKETRLEEIEQLLDADATSERIDSVLSKLSQDMTKWANELQLEHVNCPYRFDYKKLTVVVDLDRPVPLRQLGSGSNWLGIHLITYFAMQKYFILNNRPVPQFIFLDQISQVYFPADDGREPVDQDRAAVESIYKFIFDRVKELEGKLQVIVVDHAKFKDEEFQNATCEDWWSGETLVPVEWDSIEKTINALPSGDNT